MNFKGTKLVTVLSGLAMLTMGLSLPSCPGQQAIQQQIDGLTAKNTDVTRRLTAVEGQLKNSMTEMNQAKALLSQVSNTVLSQKQTIESLEETVKNLKAAPAPKTAAKAAPAAAKKAPPAKKKK